MLDSAKFFFEGKNWFVLSAWMLHNAFLISLSVGMFYKPKWLRLTLESYTILRIGNWNRGRLWGPLPILMEGIGVNYISESEI